MLRFEHNEHSARGQLGLNQIGNFLRQPFLNLRLAGQRIDGTGELAQPDHTPGWNIGDVRPPGERQQMMLAKAGKDNVLLQDHFLVIDLERLSQECSRIDMESREDLGKQPADSRRGVAEPIAVRVFADGQQELANRNSHARLVHWRMRQDRQPGRRRRVIVQPLSAFQMERSLQWRDPSRNR